MAEKKEKAVSSKGFSYIRMIYFDLSKNNSFSNMFFKVKEKEFEALKIKLITAISINIEDFNKYWGSFEREYRLDRTYRDIVTCLKDNVVIGIYKFDIGHNVLKDDIHMEILNYMSQYPDKKLSDYKIEIV